MTCCAAWIVLLFALPLQAFAASKSRGSAAGARDAADTSALPPPLHAVVPCVGQRTEPAVAGGVTYFRDCADTPDMVSFSGGLFRMGDLLGSGFAYDLPVHEVHVSAFSLARFEVSIADYQKCVEASACSAPSQDNAAKPTNHPVVGVTWEQTQDYVAWLSRRTGRRYRLPSEAEWEYAARAGSPDQYSWGNWSEAVCKYANGLDQSGYRDHPQMYWYADCDDGFGGTAPVGSFPPNAWGLYDMLGNVWEWVEDCWHSDYTGAPSDGSAWIGDGDCNKRVNRGGGWGNNPRALRVSNRDADPRTARSDGMGFRVARDIVSVSK